MSETPIPPDLLERLREKFAALKRAQSDKDIALVTATRKSDNKPVAIVCSVRFHDTGYTIHPLAVMGDNTFFDEFDFDDDFLVREEAFEEACHRNELMGRCVPGVAAAENHEERIVALLNAVADPSTVPEVYEEDEEELYRGETIEWAAQELLAYDELPDRTVDVMLSVLVRPRDENNGDPCCDAQMYACDVLAHMGERSEPALEALRVLLACSVSSKPYEALLALRAASAIRWINGDVRPAVTVASRLLHSQPIRHFELDEWTLVVHAAHLLGSIRGEASEAIPRLQELLEHDDNSVQEAAENALQQIE